MWNKVYNLTYQIQIIAAESSRIMRTLTPTPKTKNVAVYKEQKKKIPHVRQVLILVISVLTQIQLMVETGQSEGTWCKLFTWTLCSLHYQHRRWAALPQEVLGLAEVPSQVGRLQRGYRKHLSWSNSNQGAPAAITLVPCVVLCCRISFAAAAEVDTVAQGQAARVTHFYTNI